MLTRNFKVYSAIFLVRANLDFKKFLRMIKILKTELGSEVFPLKAKTKGDFIRHEMVLR